MRLVYETNRENDRVILRLSPETGQTIELSFTSAQLDFHIAEMGRRRAGLREGVTNDPPQSLDCELNPGWKMIDEHRPAGRPLFLRHRSFGWLGFVFPEAEAKRIAHWLTTPLLPVQPPPAPPASPSQPHREAGPAHSGWSSNSGSGGAWQGFGSGPGGGGGGGGNGL